MGVKFLADVNISPITIKELRSSGLNIQRVTDLIPANSPDSEIVTLALQKDAVIVTQYLDFSALIAQSGLTKPSLISLRVDNALPNRVSAILKTIIPQIEPELRAGAIVSVDEFEYRVRRLPV